MYKGHQHTRSATTVSIDIRADYAMKVVLSRNIENLCVLD